VSLPQTNVPHSDAPAWQQFAGLALRTVFIIAMIVLTFHVSLPQNETIWTAYDTTGDLIRLILGIGVNIWLLVQLFQLPSDSAGFRTWFYLGMAAVPFAVICLVATW
jgi:hypothetical protein